MNRTNRLFAFAVERQGKDPAKTFESGTRTVYRAMLALLSFPSGNKHGRQGVKR